MNRAAESGRPRSADSHEGAAAWSRRYPERTKKPSPMRRRCNPRRAIAKPWGSAAAAEEEWSAHTFGGYGHPAAYFCWKQMKSFTFSTGAIVELSQLAPESPAANLVWKQMKSFTLSTGTLVEPSQLA